MSRELLALKVTWIECAATSTTALAALPVSDFLPER
jgi:hypothetical protein